MMIHLLFYHVHSNRELSPNIRLDQFGSNIQSFFENSFGWISSFANWYLLYLSFNESSFASLNCFHCKRGWSSPSILTAMVASRYAFLTFPCFISKRAYACRTFALHEHSISFSSTFLWIMVKNLSKTLRVSVIFFFLCSNKARRRVDIASWAWSQSSSSSSSRMSSSISLR